MNKMSMDELRVLQNYPLELKIEKSKLRIREWYEHFNGEVYVSFSGGKDSTVLLHLVRSMYPDVEAVFCNTRVEYPEVVSHVRSYENVTFLKPVKPFHKVIKEHGYPVISKNIADNVGIVQRNGWDCKIAERFKPNNGKNRYDYSKFAYLIDAPFKVSSRCCHYLKKLPVRHYEKETGKHPILGNMAIESQSRVQIYLKNGCNAFNLKRPVSTPLGFWTEQDVLEYIKKYNLEIPSVYGDIRKDENGKYYTTGLNRTGCMYCLFGIHYDKYPTRFDILKENYPKIYDYAINKLEIGKVLDYINIKY